MNELKICYKLIFSSKNKLIERALIKSHNIFIKNSSILNKNRSISIFILTIFSIFILTFILKLPNIYTNIS